MGTFRISDGILLTAADGSAAIARHATCQVEVNLSTVEWRHQLQLKWINLVSASGNNPRDAGMSASNCDHTGNLHHMWKGFGINFDVKYRSAKNFVEFSSCCLHNSLSVKTISCADSNVRPVTRISFLPRQATEASILKYAKFLKYL